MFKLFIIILLGSEPTGEGYIGREYNSYAECMEDGKALSLYIGPATTGDRANFTCEYVGERA